MKFQTLLEAIEESQPTESWRSHFGMSQIGAKDSRLLWMSYRWCLPPRFSPRTKRIFSLGNAIETEIIKLLRNIPGVTIHEVDPESGKQFGFRHLGGLFSGSCDFVALGIPEFPDEWLIGECKSVSSKRFKELKKKGVKEWSSEYWAQLHCYVGSAGLKHAVFIAYCKDDSELYIEFVELDERFFLSLVAKAERIITASDAPESTWPDETYYESRWLGNEGAAIYWGIQLPQQVHCRNCRHSAPDTESGNWQCKIKECSLDFEQQSKGCPSHNFIPSLVPAQLRKVAQDYVEYETKDDKTVFWNTEHTGAIHHNAFTSKELAAMSVGGLLGYRIQDEDLQAIRTEFDAQIIGEQA
jgi:hypothetical protein